VFFNAGAPRSAAAGWFISYLPLSWRPAAAVGPWGNRGFWRPALVPALPLPLLVHPAIATHNSHPYSLLLLLCGGYNSCVCCSIYPCPALLEA
jgi:hypothetical protein